jgi:hypothetical protein
LNSLHAQNPVTIRRIYPRRNSLHRPRIGTKPTGEKNVFQNWPASCSPKAVGELVLENPPRRDIYKIIGIIFETDS